MNEKLEEFKLLLSQEWVSPCEVNNSFCIDGTLTLDDLKLLVYLIENNMMDKAVELMYEYKKR